MKIQARLLTVLASAITAACVGTDASRATMERSSATSKSNTASVDVDVPRTPRDRVDFEWITQRWPELARVASLSAASDKDTAREVLTAWAAPGIDVLSAELSDEQRLAVAELVTDLAGELALLSVQLSAREVRHEVLCRLLPAEHPDLLSAKQNLALSRKACGDQRGALALEEYLYATYERLLPSEHPDLLTAKQNLATTRYAIGDIPGACTLFEEVHEAWERQLPADHPDLLAAKLNLGVMRHALGDLPGARALFEHVHAAWERLLPADDRDLLSAKSNLAAMRKASGDLVGALELFEEVHVTRERLLPAEHADLLRVKVNLAGARLAVGDLSGATALFEYVLDVRERRLPSDHTDVLTVKLNLAVCRQALGDLSGALALFEQVHTAFERLLPPDHPSLRSAKTNVGLVRHALGDLSGARVLLEQVHDACEQHLPFDHPELLASKLNLAVVRHALGDLPGASALEESVHAAWEQALSPDHPDLLAAKQNLAVTRWALGDVAGASVLFEQVHDIREQGLAAGHPDVLAAKQNLALTRHALGDLPGARSLLESVHDAWEQRLPAEHPHLLTAKVNLAATRKALGDFTGALALEEYVHAVWNEFLPADHSHLLSAKLNLAGTHAALGNLVGLRGTALSLSAAQRSVATSASLQAPRSARASASREFDRLAWIACWSETLESAGESNLTAELLTTLESLREVSTVSSKTARVARLMPELRATLDELARVRRSLAEESRAEPTEASGLDEWKSALFRSIELRDRLERHVRMELAKAGVAVELPTIASIAAALEGDAAYIGFWRHARRTAASPGSHQFDSTSSFLALVLTPDAQVLRIELGAAAPIDAAIEQWRSAMRVAGETRSPDFVEVTDVVDDAATTGAELRALVLDPILAVVPGATTLRIVPDDVLFLVPFDALPLGDGVVGDRLAVRIGTTATQFDVRLDEASNDPSLLAIGGVDYAGAAVRPDDASAVPATAPLARSALSVVDATFRPLSGAAVETESVAELFRSAHEIEPHVLTADGATKAALVGALGSARYLHIATHGWFASESAAVSMHDRVGELGSDAQRLSIDRTQEMIVGFLPETLCGLALTGANNGPDGILTAEELGTLDLTNCELAVLSACETNVGIHRAGQGIQSLQSSLHAAGVRTAITSLWKVDDEATRKLFESFYTKLWVEKLGPADALWQAKCELRAAGHPVRDWSGWVLTGDPD